MDNKHRKKMNIVSKKSLFMKVRNKAVFLVKRAWHRTNSSRKRGWEGGKGKPWTE